MNYSANFLCGFPDDSIESLGYEFANAKTEAYQKECWDALMKKIREKAICSNCEDEIEHPLCNSCDMQLTMPTEEY